MLNKRFIYIIYDIEDFTIWNVFDSEDECISVYDRYFKGFLNISWIAVNLSLALSSTLRDCNKLRFGDIPACKADLFNEYYSIYYDDLDLPF